MRFSVQSFKKNRVSLLHRDKAMPVNAVSQNGVWPTYIAHTNTSCSQVAMPNKRVQTQQHISVGTHDPMNKPINLFQKQKMFLQRLRIVVFCGELFE